MYKEAVSFSRRHILLNSASHAVLGFGLAVLLQDYLVGDAFMAVWIAWVLVALGVIEHLYAWTR
jgi:hypothetical protein